MEPKAHKSSREPHYSQRNAQVPHTNLRTREHRNNAKVFEKRWLVYPWYFRLHTTQYFLFPEATFKNEIVMSRTFVITL